MSNATTTRRYGRDVLALAARFALRARLWRGLPSDESRLSQGVVLPRDREGGAKYDQRESENLLALFSQIASEPVGQITPKTLCQFHHRLLAGTGVAEAAVGRFRRAEVRVGQRRGADAEAAPGMVAALLRWADEPSQEPIASLPIASALIKAITVHTELLEIHPFAEGNGRVARAVEFAMLIRAGVPADLAHELHNFYNEDRSLYIAKLRETELGDRDAFLRYALTGLNRRLEKRLSIDPRSLTRRQMLRVGFTLVELVVVIMILGILAGVAAPKLLNVGATAEDSAEKTLVRNIQDGIELYYLERLSEGAPEFPDFLDDISDTAVCSAGTPCFDRVLKRGVRDGRWQKTAENEYQAPSGTVYDYNPATGEFK
ncbi:Fic/DOC family protein [Planctomycetes bacterium MalM25]|nr:Fic/DOC family protein [Planctomycetes bacterium MalM25]